jgi:crotonobetainyl-CoA:carnitine CoA-transferase CaiB-like acyl-CoA transferase
VASYYFGLNRNKRVMKLDLTADADREVPLALLADADVLVENFKTGTLEKWGLGYDALAQRFRGWCIAAYRASAPTVRSAACPATTRRSRRWPAS